jgi:hypothetical protein
MRQDAEELKPDDCLQGRTRGICGIGDEVQRKTDKRLLKPNR